MHASQSFPEFAIVVRKYSELREYARCFGEGHFGLIFVLGPPGVGKTRIVRQAVGAAACYINGNATAFGLYCSLFEHRNQQLILDDIDTLYQQPPGIRLLKALCQSEPTKVISWESAASMLEKRNIPRQFETTSPVAIIANCWRSSNANVKALEDRGHVLVFAPSAEEVHREAATWFTDQEILDFVGQTLHLIETPSLRHYVLAAELKSAKMDWKRDLLCKFLAGPALEVARLKADARFSTVEDQVTAFKAAGHGSRATFFRVAKALALTKSASPESVPFPAAPGANPISSRRPR